MIKRQLVHIWRALLTRPRLLGGSYIEYILIFLALFVLTGIYTEWVVFDITHRLFVEKEGDGTAGFLWLNYADQSIKPILGFTDIVNYPIGTQLSSPTQVTYSALLLPMRFLSFLWGPVAALNIVTLWGFIGSGMAMYWLVKHITQNGFVAFFAAYAVAFVPYHVINSSGHLSYIFSIVFVLILAAFIAFWRRQTWRRALLLALTVALAYFTDGYFLLLATVFLVALIIGAIVFDCLERAPEYKSNLFRKLKYLLLMSSMLIVLTIPILYVQFFQGSKVKSELSSARSNIVAEISYYAAQPLDYLLPPLYHPILENVQGFQELQNKKNIRSNAAESTLFAGYTIIVLNIIGYIFVLAYFLRRKTQTLSQITPSIRRIYLFIGCISLISVAIMFSFTLPLKVNVFGVLVPTPPDVLVHFGIAFWRVLARFFLPMDVMLVIFAAMTLAVIFLSSKVFASGTMRKRYIAQGLAVFLLLGFFALETATRFNRPSFDFNELPKAYSWLADQKDITVIAEFPLVARPFEVSYYYVTAQLVHGKKLINFHQPQQTPGARNALVDIDNPEAIDFAVQRGAQVGITHSEPCIERSSMKLIYNGEKDSHDMAKTHVPICIYRLQPVTTDALYISLVAGFQDAPLMQKNLYYNEMYGNYAEIRAMTMLDQTVTPGTHAILKSDIVRTPTRPLFNGIWRILQDDKELARGSIIDSKAHINATIDAAKNIQLRINGNDNSNPEAYQLSLTRTVITAQ